MRIGLAQIKSVLARPEKNLIKIAAIAEEAKFKSVDLLCFPELALTGYNLPILNYSRFQLKELAERQQTEFLQELAVKLSLDLIVGGIYIAGNGAVYNSALGFWGDGQKTAYHKHFMWKTENDIFDPGSAYPVISTAYGKIGFLICYDLNFPESARKLALAGAEVIVVLAAWSKGDARLWQAFLRVRAMENICFMAGVNSCGKDKDLSYCGLSAVMAWDGSTLGQLTKNKEDFLIVDLDPRIIWQARKSVTYFQDGEKEIGGMKWPE